jgi:hypothetical protein
MTASRSGRSVGPCPANDRAKSEIARGRRGDERVPPRAWSLLGGELARVDAATRFAVPEVGGSVHRRRGATKGR